MRQPQLIIILGTNGTGKSTLAKKIIEQIQAKRKLIILPDTYGKEWQEYDELEKLMRFEGTKKIRYYDGLIDEMTKKFHNGVILFDDFKALFLQKLSEINALRSLVIRRRQRAIDIIITAHGFTEIVPTYLFSFASKIILFRTLDNPARVKERILNFEQVVEIQKRVNEIATKKEHYFEVLNLN